ncbi:hypothetical protein [Staphylococcus felis]|uniref:hypothetical protein n=1 Tax=Staphylococcus felis TaxID=46127 RepID=UPI00115998BF|nr:hypothetical protein [Staphylococcus felis]
MHVTESAVDDAVTVPYFELSVTVQPLGMPRCGMSTLVFGGNSVYLFWRMLTRTPGFVLPP